MVRITIDWDMISPSLGVASGIASIDDVDYTRGFKQQLKNILRFRVRVKRGSLQFSGEKEGELVLNSVFEKYRKEVAEMAYSYHRGMLLKDCTFYWYEDEDIDHVQNRIGELKYHERYIARLKDQ